MKNNASPEWYRFAHMDMQAANTLNEQMHPKPLVFICYHCQQSAEKMLKGFLVANEKEAPKTHDLTQLCSMCIEIDEQFEALKTMCKFLTLFSVLPRYPNELDIIEDDAGRAILYSQKIIDFFKDCNLIRRD